MIKTVGRGIGALVDQALFAGSNFAVTILLARWLPIDAFGAFTVGLTVYLLAGTVHNGLVVEPLLVFGSGRYRHARREYLDFLVWLHWASTIGMAVLILAVGSFVYLLGHLKLGLALLSSALAVPLGLFYWFARRIPYLGHDPWPSAYAGLLYGLLLAACISAIGAAGWLSAATALIAIGVCGLLSGVVLFCKQRNMLSPFAAAHEGFLKTQWEYSRWSVGTGVLGFIPSQALLVIVPLILGLEAAGHLKASLTVVSPIMQATAALSVLLLPRFVGRLGEPGYRRYVTVAALSLMGAAALCSAGLYAFRSDVIVVLYGVEMRAAISPLLFLAWIPVLATAINVFAASLRAAEAPRRVFAAYAMGAALTLAAGIPLVRTWGVVGGALAMLASYAICAIAMWLFFKNEMHAQPKNPLDTGL